MIPSNPGNLLPFYFTKNFQRHAQDGTNRVPFGMKAPNTRLMPFQLFFEAGAGVVSWKLADPKTPDGSVDFALDAGQLQVDMKDGGGFWVTWDGLSNLTDIPDCGFWEIWLTVDGALYYSEVLHLYTAAELAITATRFYFYNDLNDKGPVLYQNSYRQYYYPTRFAWDRPQIDRDREVFVDGFGNTTISFSRTVTRMRLEVADIPDYCLGFFAKCGDLSTVEFGEGTGNEITQMRNIVFESRAQGVGLNVGIFTFDAEIETFNECQEQYTLA